MSEANISHVQTTTEHGMGGQSMDREMGQTGAERLQELGPSPLRF